MGAVVARLADEDAELQIIAGVDRRTDAVLPFPAFTDIAEYNGEADVIVDFSSPDALVALLSAAEARKIPLVLCTTGYSAPQLDRIRDYARKIPIFRSGNMSLGINLLAELVKRAASVLGSDFDVEIVERHHRRKLDAPSGTAIMLADAAGAAFDEKPDYVFDRSARREERPKAEIGISAVRGGTIVGEHTVIFAGNDEIIELRHSALSREVFAVGAVRAAKYMATVTQPGMYDMSDVLA
jgi:4-hydroxy-tetrahydrodipicolinate reductase